MCEREWARAPRSLRGGAANGRGTKSPAANAHAPPAYRAGVHCPAASWCGAAAVRFAALARSRRWCWRGLGGKVDADFGMIVEHRNWKSALALVSWSALVRSVCVILYFLAAAFSIFSATPSLRSVSMREASETHAGSTLGSGRLPACPMPRW